MFREAARVADAVRGGFRRRRILVVGDLMLDRYLWGDVPRISPEAPVPVLRLARETEVAGGAANVARNLVGLGLQVRLAGVTGDDEQRGRLLRLLAEQGVETDGVLPDPARPTTTKTRIVGDHQQMLRIDAERAAPLDGAIAERLLAGIDRQLPDVDCVLLSDYAKGVLLGDLCARLIGAARARGLPVLVDPKGSDFGRYRGATLISPHRSELALAARVDGERLDPLLGAAASLRERLGLEQLLLTLGELGVALVDGTGVQRIPAVAREVFDVSGAGDTVIATMAAARAAGLDAVDGAHLANLAAGVVSVRSEPRRSRPRSCSPRLPTRRLWSRRPRSSIGTPRPPASRSGASAASASSSRTVASICSTPVMRAIWSVRGAMATGSWSASIPTARCGH
jgi:D-beta-D-heptose 7-phosphate kinase/D-beta-D-heptose 1-phosphate adenosyltransferase